MTSHQVQKIVDVHLVTLIRLSELHKIDILFLLLDNLAQGEVLNEKVVQRVSLTELQLLINILSQRSQDPLEVFDAHNLFLIIDHEKLFFMMINFGVLNEKVP